MNSCLLIGWFGLFSGGQDKVGEVLEHPVVLEGVVDDSQEFACQCDVGLTPATPVLNTLVEVLQEWAVALGNERALNQASARELSLTRPIRSTPPELPSRPEGLRNRIARVFFPIRCEPIFACRFWHSKSRMSPCSMKVSGHAKRCIRPVIDARYRDADHDFFCCSRLVG